MSTDYFVEGNPIKVSKLIGLSGIIKEFIVETELSNGEFKPTVLSHLSQNDHYRLRISIKSHCNDKVNYFWAYVSDGLSVSSFCRYGQNDVSEIIGLIEYHCNTTLIDEFDYTELNDLRVQNTVNVLYQTDTEKLEGEKFVKSIGKEPQFSRVTSSDFSDEKAFETLDLFTTIGQHYWFKSIDEIGSKTKILITFLEYFGENWIGDIMVFEGNERVEILPNG